jgi:exopolyphosphatase/guanosine-5'-triphosphate,3'-diphosphate pyrophosphatase
MLNKKDSIAVIDIGSNSVRLCVFRGNMRSPDVLYNKKFFCGLGEYLPKTKLISKEAEKKCINSIIFFNSIIEEIKPNHSVALCTAAIRNASNKKQITNKIQKVFKGKVLTLSGRQEAFYATLGVRSAIPSANGTIIDMGGGSLELAQITPHKIKNISSFPLGILN